MTEQYLKNLDKSQLEAVTTTEGPLLILAGAGTGKTTTIIARIIHIIRQELAFASQILAVTFTNKAAKEMQQRLAAYDIDSNGIWVNTFHSIAAKILRRHAEALGMHPGFAILDDEEQQRLMKQILQEHHPEYLKNITDKKVNIKFIIGKIQRWKDANINPEEAKRDVKYIKDKTIAEFYALYQERIKVINSVDFGDLLTLNIKLFEEHPDILAEYQRRFKYIMVDEYQDTNIAQYIWIKYLANGYNNICCVGDDDQSIYSWRGANIANILNFSNDFYGAKTIKLEKNYRSTTQITTAASHLIGNNSERIGKTLQSHMGLGEKIKVINFSSGNEEAQYIINKIKSIHLNQTESLNSIAILVRSGANTRLFEEYCVKYQVPYAVIGSLKFYNRAEVKDIIAYLKLLVNPDEDMSFLRIINTPRRGIGNKTIDLIMEKAMQDGTSAMKVLSSLPEDHLLRKKTGNLLEMLQRWQECATKENLTKITEQIIRESGYEEMLNAEKNEKNIERANNLKELVTSMSNFSSIEEFIEHASLVNSSKTESDNMINIMTLHAAKGLEFDRVFLPCWEDGSFPNHLATNDPSGRGMEEERRLAYVGITRAKKHLMISHANMRINNGIYHSNDRSPFIDELPQSEIECISYGTGGGARRQYNTNNSNKLKAGEKKLHKTLGQCIVLSCQSSNYTEVLSLKTNKIQFVKTAELT